MSKNTRLPLWLRIVAAAGWFAGTLAVHQAGDSWGGFAALVVILLVSLVIEPRIAPYLARHPLASAVVAVLIVTAAIGFFLWQAPVAETVISIVLIAVLGSLTVLIVIALRWIANWLRFRSER